MRKGDSLRWRKPVMDDIGYREFLLASGRKNRSMQKAASMSLNELAMFLVKSHKKSLGGSLDEFIEDFISGCEREEASGFEERLEA